jgi:hypothetical protein
MQWCSPVICPSVVKEKSAGRASRLRQQSSYPNAQFHTVVRHALIDPSLQFLKALADRNELADRLSIVTLAAAICGERYTGGVAVR